MFYKNLTRFFPVLTAAVIFAFTLTGCDFSSNDIQDDISYSKTRFDAHGDRALDVYSLLTITSPEPNAELSGTETISGTCVDLNLVKIKVINSEGNVDYSYNIIAFNSVWSHTLDTSDLENGSYTIRVTDYWDEEEGASVPVTVQNDPAEEPEELSVTIMVPGTNETAVGSQFKVAGTAAGPVDRVSVWINNRYYDATGTEDWECYIDTTTISDGTYDLRVYAYNASNDYSYSSVRVTIDNSNSGANDIAITSPPDYTTLWHFMSSRVISGTRVNINSVRIEIIKNGVSIVSENAVMNGTGWSYTWDITGVSEGTYSVKAIGGNNLVEDSITLDVINFEDRSCYGDKQWAACFKQSEPEIYNKAKAVVRILTEISGPSFVDPICTGFLVGSEGHMLTAQHCIENQTVAASYKYELMAEGANCDTDCSFHGSCRGVMLSGTATLVRANEDLDYSLIKLPGNPSATYGYMQLRDGDVVEGERVYLPGHPVGFGKLISAEVYSGYAFVVGRLGSGHRSILYVASTADMSSGSPVLGYSDHAVFSLHTTAGCPKSGTWSQAIINDLGADLPRDAVAGR